MNIIIVIIAVIILVFAFVSFIHMDCITAFYRIGKRHRALSVDPKTKVYRFSAKVEGGERIVYSGGVFSVDKCGLYIRHELIFRPFLRTALVPWDCVDVDVSSAKSFSVVVRLDDQYDIRFLCRHEAVVALCNWR